MVQEPNLRAIHLTDCRLSLFERLIKAYRSEGVNNEYSYMLTRQGRMHREIAIFPNYAFYQNKLIPVPLPYQEEPTPLTSESHDGWRHCSPPAASPSSPIPSHDRQDSTHGSRRPPTR